MKLKDLSLDDLLVEADKTPLVTVDEAWFGEKPKFRRGQKIYRVESDGTDINIAEYTVARFTGSGVYVEEHNSRIPADKVCSVGELPKVVRETFKLMIQEHKCLIQMYKEHMARWQDGYTWQEYDAYLGSLENE